MEETPNSSINGLRFTCVFGVRSNNPRGYLAGQNPISMNSESNVDSIKEAGSEKRLKTSASSLIPVPSISKCCILERFIYWMNDIIKQLNDINELSEEQKSLAQKILGERINRDEIQETEDFLINTNSFIKTTNSNLRAQKSRIAFSKDKLKNLFNELIEFQKDLVTFKAVGSFIKHKKNLKSSIGKLKVLVEGVVQKSQEAIDQDRTSNNHPFNVNMSDQDPEVMETVFIFY